MSAATSISISVGQLIGILSYLPKGLPITVLAEDGVKELPFGQPIVTRINRGTDFERVAINVQVSAA